MKVQKIIELGGLVIDTKVNIIGKEFDVEFIEGLKPFDFARFIKDLKNDVERFNSGVTELKQVNWTEDDVEVTNQPLPRVIKNITTPCKLTEDNDSYHSFDGFISSTTLKEYKKTPAHAKYYMENKKVSTNDMNFGNAYHTFILEHDKFNDEYFVLDLEARPEPDKTMASSANKEWKQRLISRNINKHYVTKEEYNQMIGMREVLLKNKTACFLLHGGVSEESHYCEINGVKVKVRPDHKKQKSMSDLKTCEDASPDGFSKQCAKYGYHVSAALYVKAVEVIDDIVLPFFFIAQEKKEPYFIGVYQASYSFLQTGENEMYDLLEKHKTCSESGIYPGYESLSNNERGVLTIDLPNWYK